MRRMGRLRKLGGQLAGMRFVPRRVARWLPAATISAEEAALEAGVRTIWLGDSETVPDLLPRNLAGREDLGTSMTSSGISQADVPGLAIAPAKLLNLGRCRVIASFDAWDNGYFTIVRGRRSVIEVEGTGMWPEHAAMIDRGPEHRLGAGAWILDYWAGNYFHWVVYCLPKAVALAEQGLASQFLLPSRSRLRSVVEESLSWLGCAPAVAPRLSQGSTEVENLIVIDGGRFGPGMMRKLRARYTAGLPRRAGKGRRLFLSRAGAEWRRLEGENEIAERLVARGFEIVRLEGLSFREQVELFSGADVVVSPHGAGLANMVWCMPGCRIVEIGSSSLLSPDYYRLSLLMEHDYWLVEAALIGGRSSAYSDLRVEPKVLDAVVREAAN